jgi:hypothetical protein
MILCIFQVRDVQIATQEHFCEFQIGFRVERIIGILTVFLYLAESDPKYGREKVELPDWIRRPS